MLLVAAYDDLVYIVNRELDTIAGIERVRSMDSTP